MSGHSTPRGAGAAFLLDKEAGMTSRRAAGGVAEAWSFRKYGHAGTLDPEATGLLIVLMGRATRLSRYLTPHDKRYRFGLHLGLTTDTDDDTGRVLERREGAGVTEEELLAECARMTGVLRQRVPAFSAVRVGGRRAHRMARRGERPEMPEREVTVRDWKLLDLSGGRATMEVTVSSGTYVRALARDIGKALGTGGSAFGIRRTAVGPFDVSEASTDPGREGSLLEMTDVLRGYPAIEAGPDEVDRLRDGTRIEAAGSGTAFVTDDRGELVSVGEREEGFFYPRCVLMTRGSDG